jgi:hypothetical protein
MDEGILELGQSTVVRTEDPSFVSIENYGTIFLNPATYETTNRLTTSLEPVFGTNPDDGSTTSSIYSTLTVKGVLAQNANGRIVISVGDPLSSLKDGPFLRLFTNSSLGGRLVVHLANSTRLQLPQYGASYPSNWSLASFEVTTSSTSDEEQMVLESAVPGLSFTLSASTVQTSTDITNSTITSQTLSVSSMSCSEIHTYYSSDSVSTSYMCTTCSMNSSCSYCGHGICADSGTCPDGENEWSSCCTGGTCGSQGTCSGSVESGYSCDCSFFYQTSSVSSVDDDNPNTCSRLSTPGILVIFSLAVFVTFVILSYVYYRYYSGQKDRYLEELRENLLAPSTTDDEEGDTGLSVRSKTKNQGVPRMFIQDLQRSLILKVNISTFTR